MKIAQLSCALALGVLSVACAAQTDEDTTDGEQAPIDSTEQAFGESSCSGASADATVVGYDMATCPSRPLLLDAATSASSSATYGSASCTRAFVTNYQSISLDSDNWLIASDAGGALPTSQAPCEAMHVELKAYVPGFLGAIASAESNGVWNGSSCTLQTARVTLPSTNPFFSPPLPLTNVKVIAQSVRRAYLPPGSTFWYAASYRKVATWLNSGYCNNLL